MSDDSDELQKNLKKFKPKKKKMAVPKEFLEDANSYDDKLMVIRTISEREKMRVVQIFKGMLKADKDKKKK